jgi:hypothetical protein
VDSPPDPDAALLAAYAATLWWVHLPGGSVPLRLGERFSALALLPCAIVTAYNPGSDLREAEWNRHADERLRALLLAEGITPIPTLATGTGPDADRWTEPGYLASGLPLPVAVEIGRRFGQNAIVWVAEDAAPVLVASRTGFLGVEAGDRLPLP